MILDDNGRLALVNMAIRVCQESDDPRASDALTKYKRQRGEILARLQPADQVINLGPLKAVAKVKA